MRAMSLLEVRDLRFTAPGATHPTVSLDTFVLDAGECVVVRGPSGSGKTSLLRCIVGLERAEVGAVRWKDEPIADAAYPRFRADCVYLPQKPVGTEATVAEDLAFARERASGHRKAGRLDEAEQRALLDRLGLGALPWDREFDRLSVGEQQRVSLVRVLSLAPAVLLVDEPTSALDPERIELVEQILLEHLGAEPDARALVWVTHQPDQAARVATRTLELEGADA
jgi:putative ABC transport system ATP-binding protein